MNFYKDLKRIAIEILSRFISFNNSNVNFITYFVYAWMETNQTRYKGHGETINCTCPTRLTQRTVATRRKVKNMHARVYKMCQFRVTKYKTCSLSN